MTPPSDPDFTRAYTILYTDAKARNDWRGRRKFMLSIMTLPENRRNPVLLAEQAQLAIYRKDYDGALRHASLAERHWARIPSGMVFSRKAMIYEAQAAAWQGKFYKSGGDDLQSCGKAIRAWEKYQQHVSTKSRKDLVRVADQQLVKLHDAQRRLQ